MPVQSFTIVCPLGPLQGEVSEEGLCRLVFASESEAADQGGGESTNSSPRGADIAEKIRAYFAGDLQALSQIPLDVSGTDFQTQVWAEVARLAPGETATYQQIATRIGRPNAVRAVGSANANNPVALVIPCHRVIGSNADLKGYAWGVERKRWLLGHEGAHVAAQLGFELNSPDAIAPTPDRDRTRGSL